MVRILKLGKKFSKDTFSSLKVRNFRLYFIGQSVSMSGTWMQTVALGWLVLQVTHSGSQLGLVTAMQFLPLLILGPWGGLMTDRRDTLRLLIWTQTAFGLLTGILGVLIYLNLATLPVIYLFALGLGFIRVFDNPGRQTFVSELVAPEHLKNAVSLNATVNNLARAVGPSIGGILIASVGTAACFIFNAATYAVVIAMLMRMRQSELYREKLTRKKKGQITEGLRYIQRTPRIRDILVTMAVVGTFAYEFQVSLPILADQTFHAGAAGYASLMSAFGLGAVFGGLIAAGRHKISMRYFTLSLFLFGASILAVSVAPSIWLATLGMAIVGAFSVNVTTLGNTMVQLEAEPRMRGRVMALWSVAMIGSTPIGGPIIGWMGDAVGARWGLAIGGLAALFMVGYSTSSWNPIPQVQKILPSIWMESLKARLSNWKVE